MRILAELLFGSAQIRFVRANPRLELRELELKRFIVAFCFVTSAVFAQSGEIRVFDQKVYVLSETELAKMKDQVRRQCNLPKGSEGFYPWYYHYELGLALQGKNDWQRALESFLLALERQDQPKKASRIYGMWFLDYYPYYNIGQAHYHLKNWKCASEAFRLSQTLEDIPANAMEFRNLLEYKSDVEGHLKTVNPSESYK